MTPREQAEQINREGCSTRCDTEPCQVCTARIERIESALLAARRDALLEAADNATRQADAAPQYYQEWEYRRMADWLRARAAEQKGTGA